MARSKFGEIGAETLDRIVRSPEHFIKGTTRLKPSIFPPSHISHKGLSLNRVDKLPVEDFCAFCDAVAKMKPDQEWKGGFQFAAEIIRSFKDADGNRTLCLFDDPVEEIKTPQGVIPANDGHAIVIASDNNIPEEDVKEIRAHLLEVGRFVEKPTDK